MDLTPYLDSIREDLGTAASAGDEQTQRTAAVLATALEPAVRLAMMNALADLAAEVTANLDDHVVDVRLDGRDVRVVVTGTGGAAEEAADSRGRGTEWPPFPHQDAGGDISRMTLRLFEQLKGQAEQAAAAQGVSLNTFVSQAVQGALQGKGGWPGKHPPHGSQPNQAGGQDGSRLHGWVWG